MTTARVRSLRWWWFMIATVPVYATIVADHAALSQAKKIRRSRSRPYSEHGNLAGRGLWVAAHLTTSR